MGTSSWTGQGKPARRMSRAEIEGTLLKTATDLVRDNGLTVSLEHLRLDELMDLADVPKTSFYRVWSSKEAFFARLLEELVVPNGGVGAAFDPMTLDVARGVIEQNVDLLETSSGREELLAEAIRLGAAQNFRSLRGSSSWQTYMAILATLPGIGDEAARDRIKQALQVTENYFIDRMAEFYDSMLPLLRFRLRAGVTTHHVAAVGAAVVEGLVERAVVSPDLVDDLIPGTGLRGEKVEWHLAAIGFWGVVRSLVEPVETAQERQ